MKTSDKGLKFLKDREGLRLQPYFDSRGIPTIGIGSTMYEDGSKVKITDPVITEDRAYQLMKNTLIKYEDGVNSVIKVTLTQNQFDSLVVFTYNEGIHAFQTSTMLKLINKQDFINASLEFNKWERAGSDAHILHGRREKEKELFLNGIY